MSKRLSPPCSDDAAELRHKIAWTFLVQGGELDGPTSISLRQLLTKGQFTYANMQTACAGRANRQQLKANIKGGIAAFLQHVGWPDTSAKVAAALVLEEMMRLANQCANVWRAINPTESRRGRRPRWITLPFTFDLEVGVDCAFATCDVHLEDCREPFSSKHCRLLVSDFRTDSAAESVEGMLMEPSVDAASTVGSELLIESLSDEDYFIDGAVDAFFAPSDVMVPTGTAVAALEALVGFEAVEGGFMCVPMYAGPLLHGSDVAEADADRSFVKSPKRKRARYSGVFSA